MSLVGFQSQNHPQQVGRRGRNPDVDDRATAPEHFAEFDKRFGPFTLDVAAAAHNAKCERYFTIEDDGLAQSWAGERVWCNPPYSSIEPWVEKAWKEHHRSNGIVMLLPANRTEQGWWQRHVEAHRHEGTPRVEFLPGRMRFIRAGASVVGPNERPPFGCCLLIWPAPWSGPTCRMCNGSGAYPYRTQEHRPVVAWGICGECFGHKREAS